jgi:hypothetical protein
VERQHSSISLEQELLFFMQSGPLMVTVQAMMMHDVMRGKEP